MRREKREGDDKEEKRKWISVIGFLVSITLLSVAIIMSMNQESNSAKIAKTNNTNSYTITEASKTLSKDINEVRSSNSANETITKDEKILDNSINIENTKNNSNVNETNANANEARGNQNVDNDANSKKTKSEDNQEDKSFIMPVDGKIIQQFSMDSLVYSETLQEWTTHRGVDIQAEKATTVKAIKDGTVKSIKQDPRYGLSVTVEHSNGFKSVYSGLLSSEFVKEGDILKQGDSIGTVGNSAVFESLEGSHLHLELLKDGEYVNPEIYIK